MASTQPYIWQVGDDLRRVASRIQEQGGYTSLDAAITAIITANTYPNAQPGIFNWRKVKPNTTIIIPLANN